MASDGYLLGRRRTFGVVLGLLLAFFVASVSHAMVVTAIPRIVGDLGGADRYSWVLSAYLLAQVVSVALWGRLSDIYGRRPLLAAGLLCCMAGCTIAGLAPTFTVLLVGRVIQGLGAGGIVPIVMATMGDLMVPRLRAKWQGFLGSAVLVSSLVGPAIGGVIVDTLGWRWVFFAPLPLAAVALGVIWFGVTLGRPPASHALDFVGAGLLSAGLVTGLLAVGTGGHGLAWSSAAIAVLFAASAVLLIVFAWWERRTPEPIVPLELFRNSTFTAAQVGIFTVGAAVWTTQAFVPLLAQDGLGVSAARSGAVLIPFTAAVALSSILAGQVVSRTGRFRPVLFAAPVILGAGLLLLAWPMTSVDLRFVGALVVAGIGAGIASSMFPVVVQNAVPADTLGVATGASHFSRVLSGAVLLPVLGTLVASRLHAERMHGLSAHNAVTHATPIVFIVLLPLVVATFAAVFRTERGELRGVPVIAGAGSEVAT